MENVVRADTRERSRSGCQVRAAAARPVSAPDESARSETGPEAPLELYEARNAIQIARGMGADRLAAETFQKAEKSLAQAEAYQARKAGKKPVTMTAREAVQTAEDARAIAVKRQAEETLAMERQQSVDREARAESERVAAQSEADRVTGMPKRRESAQCGSGTAEAREGRPGRGSVNSTVKARTKPGSREGSNSTDEARCRRPRRPAGRSGPSADGERSADRRRRRRSGPPQAGERRAEAASQAELDAAPRRRPNWRPRRRNCGPVAEAVQSRSSDTRYGSWSDREHVGVLFDTGKYSLRPLAREKLAKVAGIVSGHPGLRLEVEGHTDSVGADE